MGTLLRIGWINLKRDRVAQALTFLLPIVFFSIFATVFGGQGDDQTSRIRVAVVDEDNTDFSRRIVEGLRKETGLRVRTTTTSEANAPVLDRTAAWALDGYLKVFWRSAPLWQLWPQVLVLSTLTVVFLALARLLARRWETA